MTCVVDVFNRAVKACTGQSLDKALVNVVFQLFDNDGDGHLSHGEFISVMKNRLHRGFRVSFRGQGSSQSIYIYTHIYIYIYIYLYISVYICMYVFY